MIHGLFTCVAICAAFHANGADGEELEVVHTVVRVADEATALALSDVDGDGDEDLVFVEADGLRVRLLGETGAYAESDDFAFPWPAENLAWTLVEVAGGGTRLAAFLEGSEVRTYPLDQAWSEDAGELELAFKGTLPRGRFQMSFYRDVDGDGRLDLVLPGYGSFAVHLARADGTWAEPLQVRLESDVDYEVGNPRALDASFGQDVRIPSFKLEDVDGDSLVDLVARTEDEVQFHLAAPELSSTPTWRLDLAALRSELPEKGRVDLSNIVGEATRRVDWEILDLDGEAPNDLIVQIGAKFRVYRGGAARGPTGKADQVLKSSGNVITFFARDIAGDALPELQLLRCEDLSLATILRWLILPGGLDFELFTYRNDGGTFSRRPTRRNTLVLEIPRLLAFMDELEELEEAREEELDVPARRAALGAHGLDDDVLDLADGALLVFHDRAPESDKGLGDVDGLEELVETLLLRDLDTLDDGETKTFDLRDLTELDFSPGAPLRRACADLRPDQEIRLAPGSAGLEDASIHTRDIDGDGRDDILVLGREEDDVWVVQLLVRR